MNLCDSTTAGVSDVIYRPYKFNYLFAYLGGSSSVLMSSVPTISATCEVSSASSVQTSSTPPSEASTFTPVSVEAGGS